MTLRQMAGWWLLGIAGFAVPVGIEMLLRGVPRWNEIPPGNLSTLPNALGFAILGCTFCFGLALLTRGHATLSSLWATRLWLTCGAFGSICGIALWLSGVYSELDFPGPQEGSAVTLILGFGGPLLALGSFIFLFVSMLGKSNVNHLSRGRFE